jgi:hypothetical protein
MCDLFEEQQLTCKSGREASFVALSLDGHSKEVGGSLQKGEIVGNKLVLRATVHLQRHVGADLPNGCPWTSGPSFPSLIHPALPRTPPRRQLDAGVAESLAADARLLLERSHHSQSGCRSLRLGRPLMTAMSWLRSNDRGGGLGGHSRGPNRSGGGYPAYLEADTAEADRETFLLRMARFTQSVSLKVLQTFFAASSPAGVIR